MAQCRQRVPTCDQNISGILFFSNIFYHLWLSPLISSITWSLQIMKIRHICFFFQYRKSDFPKTGNKLWERPQNNANFCWHILRNVCKLHRTFPILSVAGLKFGVRTCHKGQSYCDALRAAPALLSMCKNISHVPV